MAKSLFLKNKTLLTISIAVIALIVALGVNQVVTVQKAHSSFADYYKFRGCTQLISRSSDSAVCKTGSGQTITIVEFRGKWYLKNDLPTCYGNVCF